MARNPADGFAPAVTVYLGTIAAIDRGNCTPTYILTPVEPALRKAPGEGAPCDGRPETCVYCTFVLRIRGSWPAGRQRSTDELYSVN